MNIHEYQAKRLFAEFGVTVLKGDVAYTAQEAEVVAKDLGGPVWVVKSQILYRLVYLANFRKIT